MLAFIISETTLPHLFASDERSHCVGLFYLLSMSSMKYASAVWEMISPSGTRLTSSCHMIRSRDRFCLTHTHYRRRMDRYTGTFCESVRAINKRKSL